MPTEVGSMLLETVPIIFSVKLAAFFAKWSIMIITVRNPVKSARGIWKWDIMMITLRNPVKSARGIEKWDRLR